MVIFNNLNKIAIVALTLIMYSSQTHAMILAAACLKRSIGKNTPHKLLFLGESHNAPMQQDFSGHIKDIHEVLSIVEERASPSQFFLEMSPTRHHTPDYPLSQTPSPLKEVIQLILSNQKRHKNINFVQFDKRTLADYMLNDMLNEINETKELIIAGITLPDPFYSLSANRILNNIDDRYETIASIIEELPTLDTIKKRDHNAHKNLCQKIDTLIHSLLKKYNLDENKNHIFDLIQHLNDRESDHLWTAVTELNCLYVDMHLLKDLLTVSKKSSLSIILAGAYHSNNIEKRLLADYPGFEKDVSASMILPNSCFDDLANIQVPTNIPGNFLSEQMKEFLATE